LGLKKRKLNELNGLRLYIELKVIVDERESERMQPFI